jgi:hypothetical protein
MIINNLSLISISYNKNSNTITYCFNQDGEIKYFQAKLYSLGEIIRGLTYLNELEDWIMFVMPLQPKISGLLIKLSWDYIEGKLMDFPIKLVPENECTFKIE